MKTMIQNAPSPMRLLRAWLFRERAIRGPAAIELDVAERQINREEAAVVEEAAAASLIEIRIDTARRTVREALADGVIDAREATAITRQLLDTATVAHTHTQHLDALR